MSYIVSMRYNPLWDLDFVLGVLRYCEAHGVTILDRTTTAPLGNKKGIVPAAIVNDRTKKPLAAHFVVPSLDHAILLRMRFGGTISERVGGELEVQQ